MLRGGGPADDINEDDGEGEGVEDGVETEDEEAEDNDEDEDDEDDDEEETEERGMEEKERQEEQHILMTEGSMRLGDLESSSAQQSTIQSTARGKSFLGSAATSCFQRDPMAEEREGSLECERARLKTPRMIHRGG